MIEDIVKEILEPVLPESIRGELELIKILSITDYQKQTVAEWIIENYVDSITEEQKLAKQKAIQEL